VLTFRVRIGTVGLLKDCVLSLFITRELYICRNIGSALLYYRS
jgi:hypothetical protein